MNSEPRESVLLDSSDNTLEKIQDVPYNMILKESLRKKKEEKPFYMSFIPLLIILKKLIKKLSFNYGEVNGISMIIKKQEDTKSLAQIARKKIKDYFFD
ncbi:hypothetical protein BpHYR1_050429 [Brachionus plicatilis]|uniref:Uncharacterized protein n=1 Tax=Brachionus plicatilis TaxID=10195 RepID=A0A3M7T0C0_BRAPC|nr:hypothetical protein BpHYR1_050429 [Brachionus plicatilis]